MRELILVVPEAFDGTQAAELLKKSGFSRRAIIRLKQTGGLIRSGEILRTVDVIHSGEKLIIRLPEGNESAAKPESNSALHADIAYEDEDIIIFDKPPGMPVHPSIRHRDDTLANLFAAKYPDITFRPVNRLDKDTSGLCVCAKNQFAASSLSGTLEKVYFAVTDGTPSGDTVNAPIGRTDNSIIKRCVTPDGKPSVTHYTAVKGNSHRTLLCVILETGRTHQIRVHMAHIGFPLCGDEMYGGDMSSIGRQALHCGEVSFIQPVTGQRVKAYAPLPEDMEKLLMEE